MVHAIKRMLNSNTLTWTNLYFFMLYLPVQVKNEAAVALSGFMKELPPAVKMEKQSHFGESQKNVFC